MFCHARVPSHDRLILEEAAALHGRRSMGFGIRKNTDPNSVPVCEGSPWFPAFVTGHQERSALSRRGLGARPRTGHICCWTYPTPRPHFQNSCQFQRLYFFLSNCQDWQPHPSTSRSFPNPIDRSKFCLASIVGFNELITYWLFWEPDIVSSCFLKQCVCVCNAFLVRVTHFCDAICL